MGHRLASRVGGPKYPIHVYRRRLCGAQCPRAAWRSYLDQSGLTEAARNESQLAGVLAHEVAHVALRHAARQISNAAVARAGLGLLSALLGNVGGAITSDATARTMATGVFLRVLSGG